MRIAIILPVIALLPFFTTNLYAVDTRVKVIDRGMDENKRIYTIVCPSGIKTSVSYSTDDGELCYFPVSDTKNKQCLKSNDIDSAAVSACNQ